MQKIEIEKVNEEWVVRDVGQGKAWRYLTYGGVEARMHCIAQTFDTPSRTETEKMLLEALEGIKRDACGMVCREADIAIAKAGAAKG